MLKDGCRKIAAKHVTLNAAIITFIYLSIKDIAIKEVTGTSTENLLVDTGARGGKKFAYYM